MDPDRVIIRPASWTRPLPLALHFPGGQPFEVDIGCGKGRFLLARAAAHAGVSFLGLDRQLRRLRRVGRKAVSRALPNVRLLRAEAAYAVRYLLPPASVRAVYLFFPDPWPKRRHAPRRLINAAFREALLKALAPGGCLHLATDHREYFDAVCRLFRASGRLSDTPPFVPSDAERTDFELLFLAAARPVHRASFRKTDTADLRLGLLACLQRLLLLRTAAPCYNTADPRPVAASGAS